MSEEANKREFRIVDQMLSMHSMLAQKYRRNALLLSILLLTASSIICGFTFVDDSTLALMGLTGTQGKFCIGIASLLLFTLALVELKVDWGATAADHQDAAKRLAALKASYRQAAASLEAEKPLLWSSLSKEYAKVMESIVAIPDDQFTLLKACHLHKKELSKQISAHPAAPLVILRIKLRILAIISCCKSNPSAIPNDETATKASARLP
jgi:hypothetical protein